MARGLLKEGWQERAKKSKGEEEKKDTVSLRLTCVQAPVGAVSSAPDSVTGPTAPLSISEGT